MEHKRDRGQQNVGNFTVFIRPSDGFAVLSTLPGDLLIDCTFQTKTSGIGGKFDGRAFLTFQPVN